MKCRAGDGRPVNGRAEVTFIAGGCRVFAMGIGLRRPACVGRRVRMARCAAEWAGSAPVGGGVGRDGTGGNRGAVGVTVGVCAIAEDVGLAGKVVVKRPGVDAAAVVGGGGKADREVTLPGAGGMGEGGVAGVTFLTVALPGIIYVMSVMAAGRPGGAATRRQAVALIAIIWRYEKRAAPCR